LTRFEVNREVTMKTAIYLIAVAGCLGALQLPAAGQQTPTVEELVDKLQRRDSVPSPSAGDLERRRRTRGLVPPAPSGGRVLTFEHRNALAEAARSSSLPAIDIEIYFGFDSALIQPPAIPVLITLGRALTDRRLEGGRFVLEGHTDAKGAADYNRKLSQQRAESVRHFLISNFSIPSEKLVAIGYGKEQLKRPIEPLAAENRRVRVINWTDISAR
jgi:outer membrane protein OmpA-like peptidoglycan-associated protein